MEFYKIKKYNEDFKFMDEPFNKGTRTKRVSIDKMGNKIMFKYEKENYVSSEACSEKIAYEIARILDYRCAKIELDYDNNNALGVLNYYFNNNNEIHMDAVTFLGINDDNRKNLYNLSYIKLKLDSYDTKLFQEFLKILVFDALIGEQDRHEENWGLTESKDGYKLSPLYDNGDSLLNHFKNKKMLDSYYNKFKDFNKYIMKSKSQICDEITKTKLKHFELIKKIRDEYPNIVIQELNNLKKLSNNKVKQIVYKVPDELLTKEHKELIIEYLIKRRDILINII